MKRLFYFLAAIFLAGSATVSAWTVPDEVLHYALRYQWGFMDLNAGVCELSTYNIPNSRMFRATLTGKSIDMLGHYYAGGDTIIGEMLADSIKPRYIQHLDTEKGDFIIETITTDDSPGPSPNGPVTQKFKNGQVIRSRVSEYGGGVTIDLLSVFYYIRQIPYQEMKAGQTVTVNMTDKDGKDHEVLSVLYHGPDQYSPDPATPTKKYPAYYINLQFEDDDNPAKKDEMEVWISTDSARVPLYVTGTMKVGHVQARYLNAEALNLPDELKSKLIEKYSPNAAPSTGQNVQNLQNGQIGQNVGTLHGASATAPATSATATSAPAKSAAASAKSSSTQDASKPVKKAKTKAKTAN